MSMELSRRDGGDLEAQVTGQIMPKDVQRVAVRALAKQRARAFLAADRLGLAHHVGSLGGRLTSDLEDVEADAALKNPVSGAKRHKPIADAMAELTVQAMYEIGRPI